MNSTDGQITTCSKLQDDGAICGRDLDTEGYPKWCKRCRAKYQREYKAIKDEIGFAQGVGAMRDCLASEFERLGSGMFSGSECAGFIRNAPGPKFQ